MRSQLVCKYDASPAVVSQITNFTPAKLLQTQKDLHPPYNPYYSRNNSLYGASDGLDAGVLQWYAPLALGPATLLS